MPEQNLPRASVVKSVGPLRFAAVALLLALAAPSLVHGQVALKAAPGSATNPNDPKRPFLLPSQPTEVNEALEEFGRYAKRAAWDRAFKSLQKVLEANPNALVAGQDGFMLSLRARLWRTLAELPSDGKDAYRLFYDAEAKKLFDEATAAGTSAKIEQEKLTKVFSSYFATSVGDQAADRLGELYFEQGEMGKATECWQAVLDYRPDSAIPRVTLLVKTAIAHARSGRWRDFRAIERTVREKHAGESVTLGGRDLEGAKYVASLAPPDDSAVTAAATAHADDLDLAAATEPLWQFRYFPEQVATALARARQDWGPQSTLVQVVPPTAVDDSRVYINVVGHHLAIDLVTGKLLWRSEKYHDLSQKIQNQPYYVRPEQFSVVAAGGNAYFISRGVKQLAQPNAIFRLICANGADGKPVWSSESVDGLKEWSFCGVPLAAADRLYACAFKPGKANELNALAMDARTGKLIWATVIGTHQFDPQQLYYQRSPQPALVTSEGRLYVETHNGALVEVSADSGALNWAFVYESDTPQTDGWWGYQQVGFMTRSTPLVIDGVLYSKGMRSPRLYALQLAGPKLLWQRPVSKAEMLAAIDADRMLLFGKEATSIGLDDKRLRWSQTMPDGASEIRIVVTRNRIYQFTSRGIYELEKTTGNRKPEIFRGADRESMGGALFLTPGALVSVSNTAVTAYPLRRAAAAAESSGSGSNATSQKE